MQVLVLGATGFIGGQIAHAAVQEGLEVHGFRRRPGSVGAIGDLAVTWHEGDLSDGRGLDEALQSCDVLFHAAAYAPGSGYSIREAKQKGVSQLRIVLEAARRANVKRVVYTSSLTTIGTPPPGSNRLADERDGYLPGSTSNAYYEAKWVMEFEALRAYQAGLPVIILAPTAVFGPGDLKPSTSQILLMVAKNQLPVGVDMETNIVDGRDVALAHVRAATAGEPGERYIIGGHNLNVADALREAARLVGVREPRGALSLKAVTRLLRFAEFFRLPVPATMRGMPYWMALNSEKGFRTFGYTPRPFEETVVDTVGWFRENGYL
ncbi:MAG: NAD-dependent epimerase/dehydratase family protein [Anaerolineae bacterium]|nr:NAD-dependent epimerase/dehydratase family protein [Anaerolineae bacterium]